MTILTDAILLVSSESASGCIMRAGVPRKRVRILSEHLTIGPCDVDPERHVALRRAWNAEIGDEYLPTFGLNELRAAVAGDRQVVIWATRAYADLVWLWWILDGLGRLGPRVQQPILVRPKPGDPRTTVGGTSPEESRAALADARVISHDEVHEGVELWKLFASPDPRAFDEARRKGSLAFPELRESADLYGDWFPRLDGDRLLLAAHDERLLASLTNEWLITWDLNERIAEKHGWERLLWTHGSLAPFWRLRQWAARGVVAREVRYDHDTDEQLECERTMFRSTDRARALLTNGLVGVGDAPPIYVGGCRLNDPTSPWVRVMASGLHPEWSLNRTA
jgi:hypothetical protein